MNNNRGYTLLEMIVSVGIFSIVMLAATSAYLSLLQLDRHARAVNDIANNLSFAVDSMSRSIRTGTEYDCNLVQAGGQNCTDTPGTEFSFRDSETPSRKVAYTLQSGQIMVAMCTPAPNCTLGTPVALTDQRVEIETMSFYVRGVGTGDAMQPQALFTIHGSIASRANASTSFTIQGAATQRLLEL